MITPLIAGCNGVSALVDTEKTSCQQAIKEHIQGQVGGAMALSAMFGHGQTVDIEGVDIEGVDIEGVDVEGVDVKLDEYKKHIEITANDSREYYTRYPKIEYYKALPGDRALLRVAMVKYTLKVPGENDKECTEFYCFNDDMSRTWGTFRLNEQKYLPNNKRLG